MNSRRMIVWVEGIVAVLAATLLGARGGGDLASQQPKYHISYFPPAPVRSPEEEQKTFKLPPGFHIELVASEPAVEEPVAMTFDPDGKIYVAEMRGYMTDLADTGTFEPTGRVSRLESSHRDWHYDKSMVFADGLIAPRSVGLAGKGVLIGEPPNLWFYQDKKGDGHPERTLLYSDYGMKKLDNEYNPNGLMYGIDNWYYDAFWPIRFNYIARHFHRDSTSLRGQYGITQDDVGHIFYNNNSRLLFADFVPAEDMGVNPFLISPPGLNVLIAANKTYPSRVNPGVNRGYTEDLDLDGKLERPTASCGPVIYRGNAFGPDYEGNAFICEPAGNLVSRQVLTQDGLAIKANGVQHDGLDFLTSTDERFRPVYMCNGPDGALYIVDMYHGIIQDKTYISAYLQDQIKRRHLDENNGHRGRIWRVVADGAKVPPMPKLSTKSPEDLLPELSNRNAWYRETAQRLIVESHNMRLQPDLERIALDRSSGVWPITRIHAIWTLAGIESLDDSLAAQATTDPDPRVRLTALRAGEQMIRQRTGTALIAAMAKLANDPDPAVQVQVLALASPLMPSVQSAANQILARHMDDPIFRAAAINGATGHELDLLQMLLKDPVLASATGGKGDLLGELADCVVRGRDVGKLASLISIAAGLPASDAASRRDIVNGIKDAMFPDAKSKLITRHYRMPKEPDGISNLVKSSDPEISGPAEHIMSVLSWPGKPGDTTPPLRPLSAEEQKLADGGQVVFNQICASCHQPSGLGMVGTAPPLVDSPYLLGPKSRVVRIVLNGLHGPVKVGKRTFDLEMPGLKVLSDEQIAGVLTFLRRNWGHEADPIDVSSVSRIRSEAAERGDLLWTIPELMKIK